MKIILRYILNNVMEHKFRTLVMMLSIILSAALLFVSLAIGDSYESAQRKMAKGFAGAAAVSVSAKPDIRGNNVWINENEVPDLPSIGSKVGFLTSQALYVNGGHYENIDIMGADLKKLADINRPRLINGDKLNNFTGYGIVLPERFTSKYHLNAGDTISLSIGSREYSFKLTAVAAYDTVFLRSTRGVNALIPKETLTLILNSKGGYSKILIKPAEGITADDVKAKLRKALSSKRYSINKIYDEEQISSDARQKSMPFYLISFFSFTMSIFIIYSSYKVITLERLPVIGTFRSIGATEKITTKILLLESLIYGIAGGIISIPLSYMMLKLILNRLEKSLTLGIEIPIIVPPADIMISCFASAAVSLFSAYIPVRKASRLPVKDVVLGMLEMRKTSQRTNAVLGVILFFIAVLLPGILDKNSKLLVPAGGLSLLGFISSVIVLVPIFLNLLSCALEHIYGAILGNEGKLAARNLKNNKSVSQNITLMSISLSAVIVISVVGSFLSSYIGDVFHGAQLSGFVQADMNHDFVYKIKGIKGIGKVLPTYVLDGRISSEGKALKRIEAVENLGTYSSMLNIRYDGDQIKRKIQSSFDSGRNIIISKECFNKQKLNIGDSVYLDYKADRYKYLIIGCFQSRADNADAIIPAKCAENDFGSINYGMLAYTADKPEAVMVQIRNMFGDKANWSRTVDEFNNDAMKTVNSFLSPMKNLTYFILVLAAVGIINNLLINYIQKKHSIAMYKSIGMSNRQHVKMELAEGLTAGIIGAVTGIFTAYMELRTIFIVSGPRISVNPEIGVSVFITFGAAGIIITLIGSVIPIIKGFRMKLVEEIKFE